MKARWTRAQHETAVRIFRRMDHAFTELVGRDFDLYLCNLLASSIKAEFGDPANMFDIRDGYLGYEPHSRLPSIDWFVVLIAELASAAGAESLGEDGQPHEAFGEDFGPDSPRHQCVKKVLQFHRDALKKRSAA